MLLAVFVFITVFVLISVLFFVVASGGSKAKKETSARLDSLLVKAHKSDEEVTDVRKRDHPLSNIPFLNRLLTSLAVAPKLRDLLAQANLGWTPGRLVLLSVVFCLAPAWLVYLKTGAVIVCLIFGLACGAAPLGFVRFKRGKRFDDFEKGLPAALDLIVSALRSGHSLVSALGLVAKEIPDPIGREFRICFDEQNYGLELRTAMENLANRVPIQDIQMMITAILIQKETGGNLAEVLDRCSHIIRERFQLKKEIRSKTAQGRLTGMVLAAMPVGLGFLLYLMRPEVMSLLWKRPLGLKMLYAGLGLMAVGGLIIRKIVRVRI